VRFALTPLAIIDLLAFLPFYIPAVIPIDLRLLRELRLLRLIRVLKLGRYSHSIKLFEEVIVKKKEDTKKVKSTDEKKESQSCCGT
jgi:voltage-gated potassium channel